MGIVPDHCPRCGLALKSRVSPEGDCPSCGYCVIPKAFLVLEDGTEIKVSASGQSVGRALFEGHPKARTVSRKHLWIFFNAERHAWCITPVSDARTELNGSPCPQLGRIKIGNGDTLVIGKIRVSVKT